MILDKIILGITLAAPIGPVSIEMIKRGLKYGFISSFSVRIGGAIANTLCLIIVFFGLSVLHQQYWLIQTLGVFGIIMLFYLGVKGLLQYKNQAKYLYNTSTASKTNGVKLGFILAICSPVGITFWISTFTLNFVATEHILAPQNIHSFFINGFIIVGVLLWGLILSSAATLAKNFINAKNLRYIDLISSLSMLFYSIRYAINMLT